MVNIKIMIGLIIIIALIVVSGYSGILLPSKFDDNEPTYDTFESNITVTLLPVMLSDYADPVCDVRVSLLTGQPYHT